MKWHETPIKNGYDDEDMTLGAGLLMASAPILASLPFIIFLWHENRNRDPIPTQTEILTKELDDIKNELKSIRLNLEEAER